MDGSDHATFKISDISETVVRPSRDNPAPLSMKSPLVSSPRPFPQFSTINLDCFRSPVLFCCADRVRKIFLAARLLLHLLVRRRADASGSDFIVNKSWAESGVLSSRIFPVKVPPIADHWDANAFLKYKECDKKIILAFFDPACCGIRTTENNELIFDDGIFRPPRARSIH